MKGLVAFINESLNGYYQTSTDDLYRKSTKNTNNSSKSISMVDKRTIDTIETAIRQGYISVVENGRRIRYGVSRENIADIVIPGGDINAELLEKIINKLESDGVRFKYETNKEWERAGYKDPTED